MINIWTFHLCKNEHLDTKLGREFKKTFFSHNKLFSATFNFRRQECLSHLDIKLNKNCKG